ncbi:MAG: hypothetical protein ACLS7Z_10110 [Christensenellales bacterium]
MRGRGAGFGAGRAADADWNGLTERVHLGTWGGKTEAVAFLPISPVQGAALLLGGMLARWRCSLC